VVPQDHDSFEVFSNSITRLMDQYRK
jgi:hypothetical protein